MDEPWERQELASLFQLGVKEHLKLAKVLLDPFNISTDERWEIWEKQELARRYQLGVKEHLNIAKVLFERNQLLTHQYSSPTGSHKTQIHRAPKEILDDIESQCLFVDEKYLTESVFITYFTKAHSLLQETVDLYLLKVDKKIKEEEKISSQLKQLNGITENYNQNILLQ